MGGIIVEEAKIKLIERLEGCINVVSMLLALGCLITLAVLIYTFLSFSKLSKEKIDQGILERSKYLITEFTTVILQMRKLRLFGRKMELMYVTSCFASLQQILQN